MKKFNHVLAILTSILILTSTQINAENSFSSVYIFGDSLSDTGNLAAVPDFDFLNNPPYAGGFSNGPRAVEVLAEQLGLTAAPSLHLLGLNLGSNYSIAGARARGDEVIDLTSQIGAFFLNIGPFIPGDALYFIIIGGNDIRDARDDNSGMVNKNKILNEAVDSIDLAVRSLIASGASSIMIVNSADLGATPETSEIAQTTGSEGIIRSTRLLTQSFNRILSRKLAKIERDFAIDLVEFDLFSFTQSLVNNSSALGFSNSNEACFSSVTFTFHPDCENGLNFDEFVFFDEFHPTAKTHDRTGRAFFSLVPELSN